MSTTEKAVVKITPEFLDDVERRTVNQRKLHQRVAVAYNYPHEVPAEYQDKVAMPCDEVLAMVAALRGVGGAK